MSLGFCLRYLLLLVLLCLLISLLKIHSKLSSDEVYRIKHGRNYNEIGNLDEALSLFHGLLRARPLPSVVRFTRLLGQIVKMKHYYVVISLFNQMGLRRIPTNDYTLSIVISCFCHLNHMGFSLSVSRKFFKSGYEPTTMTMTTLINGKENKLPLDIVAKTDNLARQSCYCNKWKRISYCSISWHTISSLKECVKLEI